MSPFLWLIITIIDIYTFLLIANVILSWLVAFNVINTRNQFVYTVGDVLHRITEPPLRPIRNILPVMGGLDLSPVVLLIGLAFLKQLLFYYWPM